MPTAKSEVAIDFSEFRQGWKVLLLSVVGVAISINADGARAHCRPPSPFSSVAQWSPCNWSGGSTCVTA